MNRLRRFYAAIYYPSSVLQPISFRKWSKWMLLVSFFRPTNCYLRKTTISHGMNHNGINQYWRFSIFHSFHFFIFFQPSCILPLRTSIGKKSVYCGISMKYNNKNKNMKQHSNPALRFKNIANIRKIHVLISNWMNFMFYV